MCQAFRAGVFLALGALACAAGQAHEPYVNVQVGGVLGPGVYGRIEVGNVPPPPVLFAQPVVAQPVVVSRYHQQVPVVITPVYMHVPQGHVRHWAKHCGAYGMCGRPVFFVDAARYNMHYGNLNPHARGHQHGRPVHGTPVYPAPIAYPTPLVNPAPVQPAYSGQARPSYPYGRVVPELAPVRPVSEPRFHHHMM